MKVKDLSIDERPREKAMQYGIEMLSNRELIALLLRSGTKTQSALEIADEVIQLTSSLGEIANLSMSELMGIKGIKCAKGLELLAAFELGKRIAFDKVLHKKQIEQPEDIMEWLNQEIGYVQQEHFVVMFLNQRNQIVNYKTLFIGTLTNASVHPREIFKEAMKQGCAKIICAHNHPSGDPNPSKADIELTRIIQQVGEMVAIPLVDHLVVAHNTYVSLRQKQLMD